jgi:enoyl-CoA hydratase
MTHIQLKIDARIAEIVLARPEKLNAITSEMAADIQRICIEVDRDDSVRAVLIAAEGSRAFSAGSDFESLAVYPSVWDFRNRIEYATAVRSLRKPVVAALKGWALGGGAEIALAADIRVGDQSTVIGFPEVTRGWVGGGGASQMLPRVIGYGQAMKMLLTGEHVSAARALSLGLLEEVVEVGHAEERAREICGTLAGLSPVAVQSVKAAVRAALSMPLESGLRYENELNALCFQAGDHMEGINAFREDRAARFSR